MSGWNAIYNNLCAGLQQQSQNLYGIQEQIASGSRVIRASDAPSDAFLIMDLQSQKESLEVYGKNLDRVIGNFDYVSSTLGHIYDVIVNAEQQLVQGASATYGESARFAMAGAIDSLLEQAVSLVNQKYMGRYIFGGSNVSTAPYNVTRTNGKITSVIYQGASECYSVPVSQGLEYPGTVVGDDILGGEQRTTSVFLGQTGAADGSGTSSVRGDVWLTITHNTTVYPVGTGVTRGTQSDTGDTILGTSHTLSIDADNEKVRLDAGAWVSYDTATDNNLRLTNSSGDITYVNMTGLDPLLVGIHEVGITTTGKMSIDEGLTTVNLTNFSDNQIVTDSRTGKMLFVNATGIARTGTELVRVGGTYDVFASLISARGAFENKRNVSASEQAQQIADALETVKVVERDLSKGIALIGGRSQAMDMFRGTIEDIKGSVSGRMSSIQDADITKLAIELSRSQIYYQMLLSATGKMLGLSLLDYL